MKYALLTLLTVVYAALTLAAHLWMAPGVSLTMLHISYGAAGVMALINAAGYARNDRLFAAWLCFGIGYSIGLAITILGNGRIDPTHLTTFDLLLWNVGMLLFNIILLGGEFMFARIWSNSGLTPPGRLGATLGFLTLGLLLDAHAAYQDFALVIGGDMRAFGELVSVVTDIASIGLLGPIVTTAIALRGGLIVRPWLFLFASSFVWLLDDATILWGDRGHQADFALRVLASGLAFAAALAQRMSRKDLRATLPD